MLPAIASHGTMTHATQATAAAPAEPVTRRASRYAGAAALTNKSTLRTWARSVASTVPNALNSGARITCGSSLTDVYSGLLGPSGSPELAIASVWRW